MGSSRMGRDAHSFDVVHSAFPLPTLQGVLTDGLGQNVVARDMPEPCRFPSLDASLAAT